jgi:hypothetical protein
MRANPPNLGVQGPKLTRQDLEALVRLALSFPELIQKFNDALKAGLSRGLDARQYLVDEGRLARSFSPASA